MRTLTKYELLKILRKKSTLLIMTISLILTAFLFGLPIMQYQTYNQDGVLQGTEGIKYEKEQASQYSVSLTDEFVEETVQEVNELFKNPDNVGFDGNEKFLIGDAYWENIAPKEKLLRLIATNYAEQGAYAGYNSLPELDLGGGANFYEARNEKIETILNASSRDMSEKQKEYWREMNSDVETPLRYAYHEGWEVIITSFELLMFAILSVCIVIAPVFSSEYQAGTDAVILSAKYGKTKLITAKIVSSFLFAILAFTVHLIVACGLPLAFFGVDGWNLPLQILGTTIPYPLSLLQMTLINLGVIYLVVIAMAGLTLLLSAKMKTPYLVLAVLVPVLFIPMFLTPTGTAGIYNQLLFLLPYRSTMPEFGKYVSYQFGGLVLDALSVRAIVYAVLTVISIPFTRLFFRKHQVSA